MSNLVGSTFIMHDEDKLNYYINDPITILDIRDERPERLYVLTDHGDVKIIYNSERYYRPMVRAILFSHKELTIEDIRFLLSTYPGLTSNSIEFYQNVNKFK